MTQELPVTDPIVKVILFLYVLVVIMGYPLSINPTNLAVETYSVNKWFKKGTVRTWAINLSRAFIVFSSVFLSLELHKVLDKFIGIIGALFCAPLAFLIPAMCHLKLVAKTNKDKV